MSKKLKFSVLDLVPIPDGQTSREAIETSAEVAAAAEGMGFERYFIAEHHNTPMLASAATSVIIEYILSRTKTIEVGAGGVMLPNHSPLQVAETYATLDVLYPGRVVLGLGRAPGTDPLTARLIVRRAYTRNQDFYDDVIQLIGYFGRDAKGAVQAYPGAGSSVWPIILGSTPNSAYVAAAAGLPYAYATHFSKERASEAVSIYRERFLPSRYLEDPYVMISLWNFAAPTFEEAEKRYESLLTYMRDTMGRAPSADGTPRPLSSGEKIVLSAQFGGALRGSANELPESWEVWRQTIDPDEVILANFRTTAEQSVEALRIAKDTISAL